MAVQAQDTGSVPQVWEADDEIDLRKYADVVVSRWKEVVVVMVVAGVLAAAGVLLMRTLVPPVYMATARAAIVRTQTDVTLDERFTTSSDTVTQNDPGARRAALLGLVSSGKIAEQVISELGDLLTPEERNPATLLEMVKGNITPTSGRNTLSDLIDISASADTPEKAAAIANAWMKYYVQEVNRIYGQVPDEMLVSVESELGKAATAYEAAQRELEDFVSKSPLASLTRQVAEEQATVTKLREIRNSALQTYAEKVIDSYKRIVATFLQSQTDGQLLAFTKEQAGRLERLSAYLDSYNLGQSENLNAQVDRDLALSRQLYDQWLRVNGQLAAARTLQEQIATGGAATVMSTGQALQLLKLQMVSSVNERPLNMGDLYYGQQSESRASSTFIFPGLLPQVVDAVDRTSALATSAYAPGTPSVQMSLPQQERAPAAGLVPLFQLQINNDSAPTAEELQLDIAATVQSLESALASLETQISALDATLATGERMTDTARSPQATAMLLDTFRAEYPQFFQPGPLAALASQAAISSTLASTAQDQASALLDLSNARLLPIGGPFAPMQAAIDAIEGKIRDLQAQVEAEAARNRQFTDKRDLAWETLTALNSKGAELRLARAAANSEVRVGYQAVPPLNPIEGPSLILTVGLALVTGLLVGVLLAFVREYLGRPPLWSRTAPKA